jgi:formamidopyrimidine-DNA glycosylase
VPELPEVEVLLRHLVPLLRERTIVGVQVRRGKTLAPTPIPVFTQALRGATFIGISRRGKYLLFSLRKPNQNLPLLLLGHLGMTGRMYLVPVTAPLAKHATVILNLGRENFVFEDTRYFGRLTLDLNALEKLGPEPLAKGFSAESLSKVLRRSEQAIKIKLLDQSVVAGVGNIYASEALFRARISPTKPARRVTAAEVQRLCQALRAVLREAILRGSTVPLNFAGTGKRDGLFYYGRAVGAPDSYQERLQVYDRAGSACPQCGALIKRKILAARSTYYCPRCQRR